MKVASRGMPLLAAGTALAALGLSVYALATSAGAQTPSFAHSCAQQPRKGQFTCFAMKRTDIREPMALSPDATPSGYGPSDIQSAYQLPAATGSPTVAIVDAFDDPSAESDLATYRSQFGLPPCSTANGCFRKVNQNGQSSPLPLGDTGWAGEISLDLDAVSAACPNCHILLVEADDAWSTNMFTAVDTARTLGAKFISMSWGGNEAGEGSSDAQYFDHPGIVYTASSGDRGYSAGVIYPSSSQYVVSVGGTSLTRAADTSRGWSEAVWAGTGSGCSSEITNPTWQSGITVCSSRADTDVSAVADPATGLAVYQTYGGTGWSVYGGTSLSAPLIASVYAIAGTPGADDRPGSYPYAHTANLFDVTSGSNGSCSPSVLCSGGPGWDGPSGLGTPNGSAAFTPDGGEDGSVTVNKPADQIGPVGTMVSAQLSAFGGTPPYTWSATGLPAGLSIDSASGLISGTPTTAAGYIVTVTAMDSANGTGSAQFSWTITAAAAAAAPG